MEERSGIAWSDLVHEADWIGARLAPFGSAVTSVVPAGFEAYARVLHPAEAPRRSHGNLVRWREVAAWSGLPLGRGAHFHSVALPPTGTATPAPWRGQGPATGTLFPPDAAVLAEVLREGTSTPDDCWFCLWAGYGWEKGGVVLAARGEPPQPLPRPIPETVLDGPHVRLPNREYLLYRGPVEAVTATAALSTQEQTPNLWWPTDHAWCVATEIDLAWSYVGGPRALIDQLLTDERIEVVPAEAGDQISGVEDWVIRLVEAAVDELWVRGETTITTSRGMVQAWLKKPSRWRGGWMRTSSLRPDGGRGDGGRPLGRGTEKDLREEIESDLVRTVVDLVGG